MSDQNFTPHKSVNGKLSPGLIVGIVIVVIVLVTIFSSFYTVNANERGVVTRFGKYHATVEEGLQWKMPFGIDSVAKVPQTVQAKQFGFRTLQAGVSTTYDQRDYSHESEMLTGDLNIVDATWIIEYRITDPRAWLFNVDSSRVQRSSEDNRDKTLRDATQSAVNQLVGDRAILDVMSTQRDSIEYEAKLMIQETLDLYELGVSITEVKMQQVVPPAGVQDAFEDVNKAIQDRNRLINEGEQAYYAEIPRIEGEAKQKIAEAEGYMRARINRAEGEIALFEAVYNEYLLAPGVTRERLYYETLTKIFSEGGNTTLVDKSLDSFLPFKDLGQGGNQ